MEIVEDFLLGPPIHSQFSTGASSFRGVGAEVARARTCHQETSKIESRGGADSGHQKPMG